MKFDVRRWGVFNLVGFGGFLLQIGALALLTRGLGWPTLASTAVALELAALHNFLGHSRWTWAGSRVTGFKGQVERFGRYQIAKTASLAANLVLTVAIAAAGVPVEFANTLAVLMCALPNYMVADRFVFR